MKNTVIKLLSLLFLFSLFFTTCKKDEPEIFAIPLFYHYIGAGGSTDSYVQVNDSIVYFDQIYGGYGSYRGSDNKNVFYFALKDSLTDVVSHENQHQKYFRIDIKTEMLSPEVFFQKGTRNIDSIYVNSNPPGLIGGNYLPPIWGHQPAQCVFTWDYVSYEGKTFKGKGSFEIKDTIYYITHPETVYYPPQKIKFEF